jgi:hypothetical protein
MYEHQQHDSSNYQVAVDINDIYNHADKYYFKKLERDLEVINDLYDSRKQVIAYLQSRYETWRRNNEQLQYQEV